MEATTTLRPATLTEKAANGFGPNGEAICQWCGEEASIQTVSVTEEGTFPFFTQFFSAARCSQECHDEAHNEDA